jgi:small subunit ribosomal protein S20
MAITSSAKKANRVSARRYVFNVRRKRALTVAVKEARTHTEASTGTVAEKLSLAYQAIDKAAKRGVIKPNTASRKKSRLAKFVARAGAKKDGK